MNIQEYISSGIIESYVLGLASPEERAEFENNCSQYPELITARIAFEETLENTAKKNAIAPPTGTKEHIIQQLGITGKTITMSLTPVRRMNGLKYAVAACLVLLAGSLYWNISMVRKNNSLTATLDSTNTKLKGVDEKMKGYENDMSMIVQNPNVRMAYMKGMPQSPQSFTTVYWDTTSHDVYLMVNNLPAPASDKQYQLWAILNNKPVDMGIFDMEDLAIRKRPMLIQLKKAQSAQAFAITLEKKGGSTAPEGQMYVMGYL
ncbi:MAG TPA: anti-sigma factor [Chitinophagaceae bacterium]|nr:anti-sigma factor [Chitinophagaceae bacterium]